MKYLIGVMVLLVILLAVATYYAGREDEKRRFLEEVDEVAQILNNDMWIYPKVLTDTEIALLYNIGWKGNRWEHLVITSDKPFTVYRDGQIFFQNATSMEVWGQSFQSWTVYTEKGKK